MKIGLLKVKEALRDHRFLDSLPKDIFQEDVVKYLQNPSCGCNLPFYNKILNQAQKELKAYFPNGEIETEQEHVEKLAKNNYHVINCHINDLATHLKRFPEGRKQIAIARYEDQVTFIINELDVIY